MKISYPGSSVQRRSRRQVPSSEASKDKPAILPGLIVMGGMAMIGICAVFVTVAKGVADKYSPCKEL